VAALLACMVGTHGEMVACEEHVAAAATRTHMVAMPRG
jgi:hypothetical protein